MKPQPETDLSDDALGRDADDPVRQAAKEGRRYHPAWALTGLAAAVLAVAGVIVWKTVEAKRRGSVHAPAEVAAAPMTSASPAVDGSSRPQPKAPVPDAASDLKRLLEAFRIAKARPQGREGEISSILAACQRLITSQDGSLEALEARKLMAACYAEQAETDKGRQAFVAYADAVGEHARRMAASQGQEPAFCEMAARLATGETILREACRRLQTDKDPAALAYYDIILSRYPGSPMAVSALAQIGLFHASKGQANMAISTFRKVMAAAPGSDEARTVQDHIVTLLMNSGRYDEALAELDGIINSQESPYFVADALLQKGLVLRAARRLPQAIQALRTVVARHSEDNPGACEQAQGMLAQLRSDALKSVDADMSKLR